MNRNWPLLSLLVWLNSATAKESADSRIIGGQTVRIEDFPYQVSLEQHGEQFCGGVIISNKHILTAGHCFSNIKESSYIEITVRVGANIATEDGYVFKIAKVTVHPEFHLIFNDIAVIELATPLQFNEKVQPIRLLNRADALQPGDTVDVSGYGLTEKEHYDQSLQAVTVPIIDKQECLQIYGEVVKEYMICAGYREGGYDSCQGDSGGPLVYRGILVGLVSWGGRCAEPNQPGVYTDVAYFLPFIRSATALPF